ncbi:MAG TPA: plastocyanin/azurin family copper-binding protein [Solirubrobacteraceae bacterium]|jgi:plastocyanin|nr:plastocyanin/azurin family copper-binding protein [Solirubrobacteraceae bacterium]
MSLRTLTGTLATLAAATALTIPALASGGAHSASTHTVTLSHIRYHPGTLSIKRGDSVTWLWEDKGKEHNVTGKGFKSRTMTKGSFSVRFTRAGTYNYHCTIHVEEGMRGKIVVH